MLGTIYCDNYYCVVKLIKNDEKDQQINNWSYAVVDTKLSIDDNELNIFFQCYKKFPEIFHIIFIRKNYITKSTHSGAK